MTFDKKIAQLKKLLLDLPEFVRANVCRYAQHLWKFLLETSEHKKTYGLVRNK